MPSHDTPDPSRLLDRAEAARYLGVSVTTLDRWARRRRLPRYKFPASVRYDVADLRSVVASARVEAEGERK